jgi:hypothetical protein
MTRYQTARQNTVSFGLQFLAASIGALTDFCVGKLTNKLSLALFAWLVATLFVSAMLALFAEEAALPRPRSAQSAWAGLSRWFALYVNQGQRRAAWPSIVNATLISLLATITYCVLMLAFIVLRYAAQVKAPTSWLGEGSPFDQFVAAQAVKYQLSRTAMEFAGAVFLIGLLLRPPLVLPAGIMAVCAFNALSVSLPALSTVGQGPPTQLVAPLVKMDGYLLRLPGDLVVLGCLGLLACGFIMCGVIHQRIGAKSQ